MGGVWQLVFGCCVLVQSLSAEDLVKDNSTSAVKDNSAPVVNPDEELEKSVGQRIASLQKMGQEENGQFNDFALQYYNKKKASIFIPLENPTVTVKKAIGSMVYLQMKLEKTNCSKKDVNLHDGGRSMRYRDVDEATDEAPPKYCGPLAGDDRKLLDCKFDIFINERSYSETVVNHDCKPVQEITINMINHEDREFK